MLRFDLVLVFALIATSQCFPTAPVEEEDHELIGGFFEGDMEFSDDQKKGLFSGRNGVPLERQRWPNATVFYKISKEFGMFYNHTLHT